MLFKRTFIKNSSFVVIFLGFFIFNFSQNQEMIFAQDSYSTALKNLLLRHPTIFYTEKETNDLQTQILQKPTVFSSTTFSTSALDFIDIDQDGTAEVIINFKRFENYYANVYKYLEDEFIYIGMIDSSYKFYKNSKNDITLFEGSRYSDGIRYSYVYINENKLLTDTIYYENDHKYNRLDKNKFFDRESLINNNKLLDSSIIKLNSTNFPKEIEETKNKVLKENVQKTNIKILLNSNRITPHTAPIIRNDRVLLPVRTISENFNNDIQWDDKTKTVTIKNESETITLTINSLKATINNKPITLDTPPIIENEYTMLPMRFIVEVLKGDILWIDRTKTVFINYDKTDYNRQSIMLDSFSENIFKKFENSYEFVYSDNDETLMIWSDNNITNLTVHTVDYVNDKFVDDKLLYEIKQLPLGSVFVLKTFVAEGIPNIKINYTDKYHNKKSFLIAYNGRFGGNSIVEIK